MNLFTKPRVRHFKIHIKFKDSIDFCCCALTALPTPSDCEPTIDDSKQQIVPVQGTSTLMAPFFTEI